MARRDFGLRRLRRVTAATIGAAVIAAGGLSVLAASAKPGASKHPVAAATTAPAPARSADRNQRRERERHRRRRRDSAGPVAQQPAPVAPQPAPVAPQPTEAPPVTSSGGS